MIFENVCSLRLTGRQRAKLDSMLMHAFREWTSPTFASALEMHTRIFSQDYIDGNVLYMSHLVIAILSS